MTRILLNSHLSYARNLILNKLSLPKFSNSQISELYQHYYLGIRIKKVTFDSIK